MSDFKKKIQQLQEKVKDEHYFPMIDFVIKTIEQNIEKLITVGYLMKKYVDLILGNREGLFDGVYVDRIKTEDPDWEAFSNLITQQELQTEFYNDFVKEWMKRHPDMDIDGEFGTFNISWY